MKKLGVFTTFLLLMLAVCGSATAQNGQSVFSEVKIYDNLDGTGTVEARLTPNGQGMNITEMRLVGGRVGGLCVLTGSIRNTPWSMTTQSGPGNSGGTTMVVSFPLLHSTGNGPDMLDVQVDYLRRVGDHVVADSYSASHTVRDR